MNRLTSYCFVSIGALALIGGCLSLQMRRPVSIDHPANPHAQEAPFTAPPNLMAQPVNPTSVNPSVPDEGMVYTCPMHPDVQRTAPGNCPICGMALEPADSTASQSHDHLHKKEGGQ